MKNDEVKEDKVKELGIFTNGNEDSFKSDKDVKRKLALSGDIYYTTPLPKNPTLNNYLQRASERQEQMKEMAINNENFVGIILPETSSIHIMGDLHFGNPNTDNERIAREIEAIKNTPNNYLFLVGDVVDGIFWGGASDQSQTLNEQYGFLRTFFKEMKGKLLLGVSGEHDSKWASKSGADPYFMMTEESEAPYVRGVAEVSIAVGEQDYKLAVQHKAKGHSMYNKNHPTYRESRFSLQGCDVYISAHTHQKQIAQEAIREFGGARQVTHVSVGPYKSSDEYSERQGYIKQGPEEMFGASIRLRKDNKKVDVLPDILEAIKTWN